jgi:hypothetical protein
MGDGKKRGQKDEEVGQKKKFQTVHFSIDRGDFPIDRENAKVGQFILLLIETTSLSIETISQSIERLVFEKKFSNRIKPNDVLSFFKPDFHSLVQKKKKKITIPSLSDSEILQGENVEKDEEDFLSSV